MLKSKTFLFVILCLVLCAGQVYAGVETDPLGTIKIEHSPVDIEISMSGQSIYVLDDQGQLLIYNTSGKLMDTVQVGKDVDQIKVGPRDDVLFLSSRTERTVQVLRLTFTHAIDISGSPFQGPENAPVAVVVFSDFQCPYCARIGSIIDQVRAQYPKQVKSVYKNFPLSSHKYSTKAAQAAMAAGAQGKFWEFHDLIFKNFRQLNDQKIDEFVETLKLDKAQFEKTMNAPQTIAKINSDKQEGVEADVRGTPTVFVNGRMVRPANFEGIKAAVEKALQDLKKK